MILSCNVLFLRYWETSRKEHSVANREFSRHKCLVSITYPQLYLLFVWGELKRRPFERSLAKTVFTALTIREKSKFVKRLVYFIKRGKVTTIHLVFQCSNINLIEPQRKLQGYDFLSLARWNIAQIGVLISSKLCNPFWKCSTQVGN